MVPATRRHLARGPALAASLALLLGAVGCTSADGDAGPAGPSGPSGPAGPSGPQGLAGPQGLDGPIGPHGLQGIDGPQGAAGPAGPQGPQGLQGAAGQAGPAGPQGLQGPAGPVGPSGPAGTFTPPTQTWAVMAPGDPAFVHQPATTWVLEALDAATLRVRMTALNLVTASMVFPAGDCATQPVVMNSAFGALRAVGDAVTGSFCPAPLGVGSTVLVSVADFGILPPRTVLFRCISTGDDSHVCQRQH